MSLRRPAPGRGAGAVLAAAVAVTVLLGAQPLLQVLPGHVEVWDVARLEWLYRPSQRAAWLVTLICLAGTALVVAGPGRGTTTSQVALATAVLCVSWAALLPAVWPLTPLTRAVGQVLAPLLPAALLHLALALRHDTGDGTRAPRPRPPGVATRVATAETLLAYLVLGATALVRALTLDPFLDLGCLVGCAPAPPVLDAPRVADATNLLLPFLAGAVLLATVAVAVAGALRDVGAAARTCCGVLALCATLDVRWAAWPGARPARGPLPWQAPVLLEVRAWGLVALCLALLALVLLRTRRRATLRALSREIVGVTPPLSVRDLVAARLGDADAAVEFRVPGGSWVDGHGVPVGTGAPPARGVATLRRGSHELARITFSTPGVRAVDVQDLLGPACLLALESERTRAEELMHLRTLREMRRRTVEASDAARRRAERDLHDGAQHLLLAATFALREGAQLARGSGDGELADLLDGAVADVADAAGELRSVAHGMYPVLLGDAGLVPALEGLALEGTVPVTLDATTVPRVDASTELTAYRLAALAVRSPTGPRVHVRVVHEGATLRMQVDGAALPAADAEALADRAEAVGGRMEDVDGTLRLELPCG